MKRTIAFAYALGSYLAFLVTFLIEDHALRPSWHHLARIRTTVGR